MHLASMATSSVRIQVAYPGNIPTADVNGSESRSSPVTMCVLLLSILHAQTHVTQTQREPLTTTLPPP